MISKKNEQSDLQVSLLRNYVSFLKAGNSPCVIPAEAGIQFFE